MKNRIYLVWVDLTWLDLIRVVLTGQVLLLLSQAWRCMSSCYITLPYHIISYVLLFYLFCCFDLHSILFYSISFQIDLIWLNSILLNLIYYIVQYSILYQWMICVCLSVRLSVCLFICMNKFMFSLLSCFFILSFLFPFSFLFLYSLSFLMNVSLTHAHTDTDTDTQIHMNICSFLWLVHITSKACKWRIVFEW